VEARAVVKEEHFRGDKTGFRVTAQRGDNFAQPGGIGLGVVVEQRDDFPARRLHASIARAGEAPIFGQRDHARLRVPLG